MKKKTLADHIGDAVVFDGDHAVKVPEKIQIMGRTIWILHNDNLSKDENIIGQVNYHKDEITLLPEKNPSRHMSRQEYEITFLHELMHYVLSVLEYNDINEDKFVNRFTEVWYQIHKQIKG